MSPHCPKPGSTLWILDFDYALFDLYRFMHGFEAMLEREFGVSKAVYREAKERVQRRTLYTFEGHLSAIEKALGMPSHRVSRAAAVHVAKLLKRADRYFSRDAMPFVRRASRSGEVVLISYGHARHQGRKVDASGLGRYCDRIIFTRTKKGKAAWVKRLAVHGRRVMIVNDDPGETRMMASALKRSRANLAASRVILVERPEGKYYPVPPHRDYEVVRSLAEIFTRTPVQRPIRTP